MADWTRRFFLATDSVSALHAEKGNKNISSQENVERRGKKEDLPLTMKEKRVAGKQGDGSKGGKRTKEVSRYHYQ